ncbi:MAG: CoA transferase [Syntrophaceae bacterium]|nr:CoA transferase [Syntrophaceae bacterium]
MGRRSFALDMIRIIDLTDLSGAYCTKLLADLGADVIRVEPAGGDNLRRLGPFYKDDPHPERSLHHFFLNTNKRSVTLNLETEDGKNIFRRLSKRAQIIIETFPPGYLESLGLGYSSLAEINPSLIFTSITPFGQNGPYRDFKGSDMICWAMGGLMYLGGFSDRPPVQGYEYMAYKTGSMHASVATLIAFYHLDKTGEGQYIDVSVQECVAQAMENAAQYYDLEGVVRCRQGLRQLEAGAGIYPCKDGFVYMLVAMRGTLMRWDELVDWLIEERTPKADSLKDSKWKDKDWRQTEEARNKFYDIFTDFSKSHPKLELYEKAQAKGISLSPVSTIGDLFENPQLKARGFFQEIEHPELGVKLLYPGGPYVLEKTPWRIRRRAPLIGEHNTEIFHYELGIPIEDLGALMSAGVI